MMLRGICAASVVMCCGLAAAAGDQKTALEIGAVRGADASAVKKAEAPGGGAEGGARRFDATNRGGAAVQQRLFEKRSIAAAVVCPAGATPEGEPDCVEDYVDATNGGCNSTPAVFTSISDGETVCGTMGTYIYNDPVEGPQGYRDTDWYEFTTTDELSTVTFTGTGDANLLIAIFDSDGLGGCGGIGNFLTSRVVFAGSTDSVSAILPAGTWYLFAGAEGFSGVPCGTDYAVSLDIEEIVVETPEATDLGEIAGENDYFTIGNCDSAFNSEIGLWNENGDLIVTDDDGCGAWSGPSQLYGLNLPQGRYYLSISGWDTTFDNYFIADVDPNSSSGDYAGLAADVPISGHVEPGEIDWYTFTIGEGGGCELVCPEGGIPEGEPLCGDDYVDDFNGGCNSVPPVFGSMNVGETICGTAGTFIVNDPDFGQGFGRDTDWYEFTLTEGMAVTLSGIAEFPLRLAIYDVTNGCENSGGQMISASALPCESASAEVILGPGTYAVWAGPNTFEGVECGSNYEITLLGEPYERAPLSEQSVGSFTLGETVTGNNADDENLNDLVRLYPGIVRQGDPYASPGPDEVWTYHHPGGAVHFSIAMAGENFSDPAMTVWSSGEELQFGWRDFWYDQVWFAEGLPAGTYYVLVDTYNSAAAGEYTITAEPLTHVVSGDTTGGPRWHRPEWGFDGLSPDGTNVPYDALSIEVSETGVYDIFIGYSLTDGWDGFVFLYTEDFDPDEPLENTIAFNDDYLGTQTSIFEDVSLTAGEVYTLVITGWNNAQDGTYAVASRGPGTVSVVEECVADYNGDGSPTIQDLLVYLGDFRDGLAAAEMDGEDGLTVRDLLAYLVAFRAGC